jgi:hypothetical protein
MTIFRAVNTAIGLLKIPLGHFHRLLTGSMAPQVNPVLRHRKPDTGIRVNLMISVILRPRVDVVSGFHLKNFSSPKLIFEKFPRLRKTVKRQFSRQDSSSNSNNPHPLAISHQLLIVRKLQCSPNLVQPLLQAAEPSRLYPMLP